MIVHGGAGRLAEDRHEIARAGVHAAATIGLEILAAGGSALDAVQAAVRVLEDDPEFNAGVGAVLTREGGVELDASIMDGSGRIGAVAAVPELRQPVDLARAVLDDGEHVMLAGEAAWRFASARGFARAHPDEMITPRARARHAEETARRSARPPEGGTVGAVAIDAQGRLAAATSTGGIAYKRPGRVGDTPLPGCGTWADDRGGAASATGDGEAIIRVTLTRRLVDALAAGVPAADAARAAIADLVARTGGTGGVIVVDRAARLAAAHCTDTMPVGVGRVVDGIPVVTAHVRPGSEPAV
jgi:beta-aspartyl-peptidase (threonine type)